MAEMPKQQSRRGGLVVALGFLAPAGALATGMLALLVLVGWQFDIEALMRIRPQWVAMNPATAMGLLLASASLGVWGLGSSRRVRQVARILALLAAGIGAAKLMQWMGGPNLNVDELLFRSRLGGATDASGATLLRNAMAPNTAFLFLLTGAGLFTFGFKRRWLKLVSMFLPLGVFLVATLALIGYVNGVTSLYRPTEAIAIALHSVLAFLVLSLGVLSLHFRAMAARSPGRTLASLNLDSKINLGFGSALFLLAIIGMVSFASIRNFVTASAGMQHSREVIASITDLEVAAALAESSDRGYVITGQDSYLEPYRAAVADIHARYGKLRSLVADNPGQEERLNRLGSILESQLGQFQQAIGNRKGGPAAEIAAVGESQKVMDAIRGILADMSAHENALESVRSAQAGYTARVTMIVISIGGLLAFALVGLAGWVIRKDLALRHLIEQDLHRARAAADRANEAKSSFLANMSHEIRTPMAAIIGYADLVLDPLQTASDRLDYVNTIRRNGDHLLTIINDVLDLSKIEAGKFTIDRVACCPCRVLSDVASLMRVRAVEKKIGFEVKNEGPIPALVQTDAARLRQVLINLVGNAIKFTDEGWVRLIMKLEEPAGAGPRLRFDIIDTGIGMSPDQIASLFQPFVQVDGSTTRRFGGTGLGLTISKRLAELLSGSVAVDSAPGRGSTFTLFIDPGPLENVACVENCREALASTDIQAVGPASERLEGRILLVDDGIDNRRLLSIYLRQAGAQVALAENGRIGCDKALASLGNGSPYDVILMDMQMPELDGYGAASRLRTKGYTGPIVALTANAMAEDREKCLNAGCTDYLSKPVRRAQLLAVVGKYLDQSRKPGPSSNEVGSPPASADLSLPAGPIKSDLDDETLHSFLLAYIRDLPVKIMELQTSLDQGDMDALSESVHNLKGTGGLYGLMPISTAAGKTEALIQNKASIQAIESQVKELMGIIRRVEGFDAKRGAVFPYNSELVQ